MPNHFYVLIYVVIHELHRLCVKETARAQSQETAAGFAANQNSQRNWRNPRFQDV